MQQASSFDVIVASRHVISKHGSRFLFSVFTEYVRFNMDLSFGSVKRYLSLLLSRFIEEKMAMTDKTY